MDIKVCGPNNSQICPTPEVKVRWEKRGSLIKNGYTLQVESRFNKYEILDALKNRIQYFVPFLVK